MVLEDNKIKRLILSKSIIFLLFVLLIFCFLVFLLIFTENTVIALSGDYNSRGTGDSLIPKNWNDLDEDFVAKNNGGDTMSGNLNMEGNFITNLPASSAFNINFIATVDYANSITESGATDENGNPKKLICDSTALGATGWQDYVGGGIMTEVYTTDNESPGGNPNFSSKPMYLWSIVGTDVDYGNGTSAVYIPNSTWPTYGPGDELRKFLIFLQNAPSAAEAEANGWRISWCGVGN